VSEGVAVSTQETDTTAAGGTVPPAVSRYLVAALWAIALVAAVARIVVMVSDPILPGDPWRTSTGEFGDFRDVVWVPGNHVLDGGNPYDPVPYLADHPWAQHFSAYPPVWLVFGVLLGPLPYLIAAVVFQVMALGVAVAMLRTVARWLLPAVAPLAVPIGLFWMNVWYPGRGALASLGSVLAVLGVALVLRSVCRPAAGTDRAVDWACVAGIAFALVKPQFGVVLLAVAVAGGRLREAWRGVVALAVACLPLFVVVSVSAGGPVELVRSVLRNQQFVWGPDTPGGLGSPFERRLDVFGAMADFGFVTPPGWLVGGVALAGVAVAVLAVRRTRDPFVLTALVCGATMLTFFHPWYDLLLLLVPVAAGTGMVLRRELTDPLARVAFAASVAVVLHLHTVTTRVVPGLTPRLADQIDFAVLTVSVVCAVLALLRTMRRRTAGEQTLSGG
jgi:hypothetical protein